MQHDGMNSEKLLMCALDEYAKENNMVCNYITADDAFRMVDSEGIPLVLIIEQLSKRSACMFPWYGYARRRWHAGKNKESIISEIREALMINSDFADSFDFACEQMAILWPDEDFA